MHILIVDDEPHIRMAIAAMLSKQGHNVLEAHDGFEALRVMKDNPLIRIAICDLYLPGMEGEKLVEVIKEAYPQVRVIVTSVSDRRLWEACKRGADHKLVKPFGRQEFLNVLGAVVNGARAYAASA